ncbi:DUF1758 domain-containing protein [Trichonephila clavipes]|nr:DUF1758 domain-containing protein [Trichonephila clavipes]
MSGSQKRKIRKEKEYNINSKYAKSDNFLISASSSSCASSSSSNARELDEQGQAHPGIHKRRIGTEVDDILDSIVSICEEKDKETYCTEKDDILDTLEAILVAIDTQLMPSIVNSDFEITQCANYLEVFPLADPTFYKSGPIDVLLGVDLTLPVLKGQMLSLGEDKPFAIRSELGWIIVGKFDSVSCAKPLTSVEEACENHFVKTHSTDENGRYTVRLPFPTPPTWLGNSKQNAIRRLISVERHLISNSDK